MAGSGLQVGANRWSRYRVFLGRCLAGLEGGRFFRFGQALLEHRVVRRLQVVASFVGLLCQFGLIFPGWAADFTQHLVVQRAGAYWQFGALDVFLAHDVGFVFLEDALDGGGVACRAIVTGDRFDDAVAGAGAAVDQLFFKDDPALCLDDGAFALEVGAVDLDALAGLGGDDLPGRGGREAPRERGQQAGDDQMAHGGSSFFFRFRVLSKIFRLLSRNLERDLSFLAFCLCFQ